MDYLATDALISDCGNYRYFLSRRWDAANVRNGTVVFLMLNPSTADATVDDPTIHRCVGFAKSWGFGGVTVVNLFAFRATDPKELAAATDPVGPRNDDFIRIVCADRTVVCAWGSAVARSRRPVLAHRPGVVRNLLRSGDLNATVRHLGLTADGHPKHPLYLKAGLVPAEFAKQ